MTRTEMRIFEALKRERRAQGVTQAALAASVGCKQSAVSMYEAGQAGAISEATVGRIAECLGVDLSALKRGGAPQPGREELGQYFCPVDDCLSNFPYLVRGELFLRPTLYKAPQDLTVGCPWCPDVLLSECPSCGASLHEGAFCPECRCPYVTVTEAVTQHADLATWVRQRQDEICRLKDRTQPIRLNGHLIAVDRRIENHVATEQSAETDM